MIFHDYLSRAHGGLPHRDRLQLPAPGAQLLPRLVQTLRPGDVLLVEGNARISQIIMYMTQSSWSHAAMYMGDALLRWGGAEADLALERFGPEAAQLLIESDLQEGVAVVPLSHYLDQNLRICRPVGLRPESLDRVLTEMLQHLGVSTTTATPWTWPAT